MVDSASRPQDAAPSVVLADLGLGNLRSVERALQRAGGRVQTTADPAVIRDAERLVVPGQGSFRDGAVAAA